MLDARQQKIKDATARAEQLRDEAEELRQQYESRLLAWDREQESSHQKLEEELAQLRGTALENLKQALAAEEAKLRGRDEALIASREAALARNAAETAYVQVAAMLQRLASPQLTHNIVGIFLEDLSNLPETEQAALRKAATMLVASSTIEILSAHALNESDRAALGQALSTAAGQSLQFNFKDDPALIAGVRAVVGECQLHANLADELAFFRNQSL